MTEPRRSRRAYLAGLTAVGAPLLAGCPSTDGSVGSATSTVEGDGGPSTDRPSTRSPTDAPRTTTAGPTESTPSSTTASTPTPGGAVRVAGQLVDGSGAPVTDGRIFAVGGAADDLIDRGPNDQGQYGFELTAHVEYAIQYGDSPAGLPDHFTVAVFRPDADQSLGRTTLPRAYEVDVTVETADGTDVTDESRLRVWHTNDYDETSWVDVVDLPVELASEVELGANYEGSVGRRSLTVDSPTSVTLTVDG